MEQEHRRAEAVNRALFGISNAVNTTLNLDELYASIHASLMQIIDVSNFYIALYHKHKNSITFPYYVDEIDHNPYDYPEIHNIQESDLLTAEVIRSKKPLLLSEGKPSRLLKIKRKKIIGTPSQVWMGVPLKVNNKVIGVMASQSYRNPFQFDAKDVEIFNSVSDQVALAIERKRTQEALKRSERRHRDLVENLDAVTYLTDQKGFFTYVSPAVKKITGCGQAEMIGATSGRFDQSENQIKTKQWLRYDLNEENPTALLFEELIHPDDRKQVANVIRKAVADLAPYKVEYRIIKQNGLENWVYEKGRVLSDDKKNKWLEGVILDIQERKYAEEINRVLFGISNAVNTTFNLDELYASIHDSLSQIIDTTNFYIALYDEEMDSVTFTYDKGEFNEFHDRFRKKVVLKITDWTLLTGVVIKTGKPLLIKKDAIKGLVQKRAKSLFGVPCEVWLGVPLKVKGKVIGAMAVQSYNDPDRFSRRDMDILLSVSDQVAIAIDRKRSHEELEKEVTERKQMEKQIKTSLQEKEILLREIHHRVKNNLQIIYSLLNLQSRQMMDPQSLEMFRESRNRVKSIAMIHEKLYRSHDLVKMDTEGYIKSLIDNLYESYGVDPQIIEPCIKVEQVFLGIDLAIPCGLIINELVSNSLKHAFPAPWKGKGKIEITFQSKGKKQIVLRVSDNGIGLPKKMDIDNLNSLGLKLVSILTQDQLFGKLRFGFNKDKETKFTIIFPKPDARKTKKTTLLSSEA